MKNSIIKLRIKMLELQRNQLRKKLYAQSKQLVDGWELTDLGVIKKDGEDVYTIHRNHKKGYHCEGFAQECNPWLRKQNQMTVEGYERNKEVLNGDMHPIQCKMDKIVDKSIALRLQIK